MTFEHIVDRQMLHFPWSYMLTDWVWVALYALRRVIRKDMLPPKIKGLRWFIGRSYIGLYAEAAILVLIFAFWREPHDVGMGDPWWKSYIDATIGWAPGAIVNVMVNYRKWYWIVTWGEGKPSDK